MAFFKFIKVPKNQSFQFKPRYWDPEKEALEERLEQIKKRQHKATDPEALKSRISRGFRSGYQQDSSLRSRLVYKSNVRLMLIIILLIILTYYLLISYLPAIIQALG